MINEWDSNSRAIQLLQCPEPVASKINKASMTTFFMEAFQSQWQGSSFV
jgi:hypothetical protein